MDCKNCHETERLVIEGKAVEVDKCIAPIIEALNNHPDIRTTSSCCGHGKHKASFLALINADYVFFEIELHEPLKVWELYRPIHEAMIGEEE